MPGELTVGELLELYASSYPRPTSVKATLELVGLKDQRQARAQRLSGGQQRRLDVGLALIGDRSWFSWMSRPPASIPRPAITPGGGRQPDELGKTVFLTTHYMEEAQALADRVAVIADGEIVSQGTPETLGGRDKAPSDISLSPPIGVPLGAPAIWPPAPGCATGDQIESQHPARTLYALASWAMERSLDLDDLTVGRPTLEDVYLKLTEGG